MILFAIGGLVLGCLVAYFGRPVLIPLAVAGLLQFVLAPVVRSMSRVGVPPAAASAVLLLGLVGGFGAAVYYLTGPAIGWVGELQDKFWRIEWRLAGLKEPLEDVARATKRVGEMTNVGEADPSVVVVRTEAESPLRGLIAGAFEMGTMFVLVFFLLFFLLARDGILMKKIPVLVRNPESRERLSDVYLTVEREVSTYLFTISAINAGLGVAVGLAMYFLGVPNAALWGLMACFLNYIPYLGGIIGVIIIGLVSLMSDSVVNPLFPPLAYIVINGIEGMVITPLILGKMLTLSPVAVFLWLILWGWVWGVPGALLAVPMLAVVKMVCERVPSLYPVARLLDS